MSVRLQRGDRALDQLGAVVDRDDLRALGQARRDLARASLFTLSMTVSAFSPERCTAMPVTASPSPFSSATPRRSSGASSTRATSRNRPARRPRAFEHDLLDVLGSAEIAASAHHELGLGQLYRAPAHVHVGGADGLAHLGQRDVEGLEPARVDDDARTGARSRRRSRPRPRLPPRRRAKRTCQSCVVRSSASVRLAAITAYW